MPETEEPRWMLFLATVEEGDNEVGAEAEDEGGGEVVDAAGAGSSCFFFLKKFILGEGEGRKWAKARICKEEEERGSEMMMKDERE